MVHVRFFAAARAAAGRGETVSEATSIGELLEQLSVEFGSELNRVLGISSLLVDGSQTRPDDVTAVLPDGAVVDVLPPFAGG